MDLLKNKNNSQDDVSAKQDGDRDGGISSGNEAEKKVNLDRYQDPEGLTLQKMALGLWFVQNRKHFIFIFSVILAIIAIVTWGRFFYVYGSYVISGMKYDDELSREIVTHTIADHEFFEARAPKDLKFGNLKIVKGANDKYDFLIEVINPNDKYWVEIESHIVAAGVEFGHSSNFVLPSESKFFLVTGQEMERFTTGIEFVTDRVGWHRVNRHIYPDWVEFSESHLNINVKNPEFVSAEKTVITEKIPLNTLDFTVSNNTAYNYWEVDLNIVIYGINNKILILDKYILNNFMSSEERTINITIPGDYPTIGDIQIFPEVNIAQDDIYIKFDGGAGEVK